MKQLSTSKLCQGRISVRPFDDKSNHYKILTQSIANYGVLVPLAVRLEDQRFCVFDGFHRLAIARDLQIRRVPCRVFDVDDIEMWELQLQLNPDLNPRQIVTQLFRLVAAMPDITLPELSRGSSVPIELITESRLLANLDQELLSHVISGEVTMGNAIALTRMARYDLREARKWLLRAICMETPDFIIKCTAAARATRDKTPGSK